jgi:hypothetical protein
LDRYIDHKAIWTIMVDLQFPIIYIYACAC